MGDTVRAYEGATPAAALVPGTSVGRYQLVSMLGAGGMGVVWSANDPQLERTVAIKLVHPALVRAPDASLRLLREARAMAKLSHRAVVTVHDAGAVDGQLFLAMELVAGTTLGALLRSRDTSLVDWPRWLAMIVEAGRGLVAAHGAGVLHRDFKPDNVLVDTAGRVCVSDFGLATLGDAASGVSHSDIADSGHDLTCTGALLGTPAYMSPQQLRSEAIDAKADQFSFCVTAYEVLYGQRPFSTDARGLAAISGLAEAIEARQVAQAPQGSTVPEALRAVILRGLAPDPAERWPDMAALLRAIEDVHEPIAPPERPHDDRPKRVLAFAIACALALIVFAILAVSRTSKASREPAATPQRLFGVPFGTRLALSDDGRRIALAADRIEIRDLDGRGYWSRSIPGPREDVGHLELAGDRLRIGFHYASKIERWSYAGDNTTSVERELGGRWYGTLAGGELLRQGERGPLVLVHDGKVIDRWPVTGQLEVSAPSPDKQRFAYLDKERFFGTIVVIDSARHRVLRSEVLTEPVGLCWIDSNTLAYSTGTDDRPTIWRIEVTASGFGPPSVLYTTRTGWFSRLVARPDMLYFVDAHPSTRVRLLERDGGGTSVEDFDPSQVGVGLGWTADDELLSWNRATGRVERLTASWRSGEAVGAQLDGEPANATVAGDMLMVALRRPGGRELVGISLTSGRIAWRLADRSVLVARCAGDSHAPCFALRRDRDLRVQLVPFDPASGRVGSAPIIAGALEDVAIDDAGERLTVVGAGTSHGAVMVREIDRSGAVLRDHRVPLETTRGVAYDPAGGILVAGTLTRTTYQVGRLFDGEYSKLLQSDTEILTLVRPAHRRPHISILGRTFSPELMKLALPHDR